VARLTPLLVPVLLVDISVAGIATEDFFHLRFVGRREGWEADCEMHNEAATGAVLAWHSMAAHDGLGVRPHMAEADLQHTRRENVTSGMISSVLGGSWQEDLS